MLVNRTLNNSGHEGSHYKTYKNYFYHIGLDGAKQLGHKLELLVTKCKVGIKQAFRYYWHSCSEFGTVHYFPAPEYFNCYVLDFYNASFNNPLGSIKLVLYMDNFDRKNGAETECNGIHLFFHKRNTFNDENMYFMIPGQKTYLDVSYSYVKQLPQPYGDCIEEPENKIIWTLNGRKLEYSKLGCQYAVYQRQKNYCCGCINENYPIIDFKIDTLENLTSCRKFSENYVL